MFKKEIGVQGRDGDHNHGC